jgi:hypothetical protein
LFEARPIQKSASYAVLAAGVISAQKILDLVSLVIYHDFFQSALLTARHPFSAGVVSAYHLPALTTKTGVR